MSTSSLPLCKRTVTASATPHQFRLEEAVNRLLATDTSRQAHSTSVGTTPTRPSTPPETIEAFLEVRVMAALANSNGMYLKTDSTGKSVYGPVKLEDLPPYASHSSQRSARSTSWTSEENDRTYRTNTHFLL